MINLNRAVRLPLRPLGLDAGRALANARPDPAERAAQREALWRQVQQRFAPPDAAGETGNARLKHRPALR